MPTSALPAVVECGYPPCDNAVVLPWFDPAYCSTTCRERDTHAAMRGLVARLAAARRSMAGRT